MERPIYLFDWQLIFESTKKLKKLYESWDTCGTPQKLREIKLEPSAVDKGVVSFPRGNFKIWFLNQVWKSLTRCFG